MIIVLTLLTDWNNYGTVFPGQCFMTLKFFLKHKLIHYVKKY